jgi:hypothetical protein
MVKKRILAAAMAGALATGGLSSTALAKAPTHWTKSQCHAYRAGFLKRNPHAASTRKAQANRVLKANGCSQRV